MKRIWGYLCIIGCCSGIYIISICENLIQVFASLFLISILGTLACVCFIKPKHRKITNSSCSDQKAVPQEQKDTTNSTLSFYEDDIPNLLAWQNVLYPDTPQLRFDANQLKHMSAFVIPRHAEIAHDCMELINSTLVPQTFFLRYDLLIEKLTLLSNLEKYVRFNTYSPTQQLSSAIRKKPLATKAFIDRYWASTIDKANSLKTEKGKRNRYKKAYDVFMKYSEKMTDENLLYFKNKYMTVHNNNDYDSIILPNGKTIREQQEIDYKKAQGIYPPNTPRFLDMWIVANTTPPKENYFILNNDEKAFFYCFHSLLLKDSLDPNSIKLTRLSSGTFNIDYVHLCYVGVINLYRPMTTYAVIKEGNKKATKVFSSKEDAINFISEKEKYTIETRQNTSFYMQYEDDNFTKELRDATLEEYISHIPYWITRIKKCLAERLQWSDPYFM